MIRIIIELNLQVFGDEDKKKKVKHIHNIKAFDAEHNCIFSWYISSSCLYLRSPPPALPSNLFEGHLIRDPSIIIMQITAFSLISFGVNKWQSNLESVVNASAWVHSSDTKLLERETKVVVRRRKRKTACKSRWEMKMLRTCFRCLSVYLLYCCTD